MWLRALSLLLAIVVTAQGPPPPVVETSDRGHHRMLALLDEVRIETAARNPWLGNEVLGILRGHLADLPRDSDPQLRFGILTNLAEHELRLGYEENAIAQLEEAHMLSRTVLAGTLPKQALDGVAFRLAIAHLRYAETQNCALNHSAESCLMPLRGGGIHTLPEGSREAIDRFVEVLEKTPRGDPLHIKSLWLLNLAYMTLGEYPDGVPEPFRIPPAVFESSSPFPRFSNVAPMRGLATFNLSGGAAVDDFDGDDRFDIFTTTFDTAVGPRFFRGDGDGGFVDATESAGLSGLYGGLNLVHADYDNDGDLDIYILRGGWFSKLGRHPNSLLQNDGHGHFRDVTFDAGLGEVHYPTQTAAWADYDNDGDLDLFVGNEHEGRGDETSLEAPCQLFRNAGDGTFTDVAASAGVSVRAYVKGVAWGDYDNDRFPDLYVSVLGGPNRLFHNQGDGTFVDVAESAGVTRPQRSFPVWFWDYDNDGALDIYVPSYFGSDDGVGLVAASYFGLEVPFEGPRLYKGDGHGHFADVTLEAGLRTIHLPMGSNFGDIDSDGFLDFYLGTGYPDYEALMPNVLYWNRGGKRFLDVTWSAGLGHLQKGHAVAFADIDGDGDQDIFAQMGGALPGDRFADALFLNPGFGNHWLSVQLVGTRSNRAGLGARIRVDVIDANGGRSIYRHVNSGGSFGGNPLRQTLGLGSAERIERLEIFWPTTALTQSFEEVPMDAYVRVVEGVDELGV